MVIVCVHQKKALIAQSCADVDQMDQTRVHDGYDIRIRHGAVAQQFFGADAVVGLKGGAGTLRAVFGKSLNVSAAVQAGVRERFGRGDGSLSTCIIFIRILLSV
jgi:hypothetical protein